MKNNTDKFNTIFTFFNKNLNPELEGINDVMSPSKYLDFVRKFLAHNCGMSYEESLALDIDELFGIFVSMEAKKGGTQRADEIVYENLSQLSAMQGFFIMWELRKEDTESKLTYDRALTDRIFSLRTPLDYDVKSLFSLTVETMLAMEDRIGDKKPFTMLPKDETPKN